MLKMIHIAQFILWRGFATIYLVFYTLKFMSFWFLPGLLLLINFVCFLSLFSCAEKWPVNYNLVILLLIILVVPTSDLSWIFIKKQKYFHLCLDDQPLGPANI